MQRVNDVGQFVVECVAHVTRGERALEGLGDQRQVVGDEAGAHLEG